MEHSEKMNEFVSIVFGSAASVFASVKIMSKTDNVFELLNSIPLLDVTNWSAEVLVVVLSAILGGFLGRFSKGLGDMAIDGMKKWLKKRKAKKQDDN